MWRAIVPALSLVIGPTTAIAERAPATATPPATCAAWNENRPNSHMRVAMIFWVRAYISSEKGRAQLLNGYRDRDLQRLLNEHCEARPVDDIQGAADALEKSLTARQAAAAARPER